MAGDIKKRIVFSVDDSKAVSATKKLDRLLRGMSSPSGSAQKLIDTIFQPREKDTKKFVDQIQKSLTKVKRLEQQMFKDPRAANAWAKAAKQLDVAKKKHKEYLDQEKELSRVMGVTQTQLGKSTDFLESLDSVVGNLRQQTSQLREEFGKMGFDIKTEDLEDSEQVIKRIMDRVAMTGAKTAEEINNIIKLETDAADKATAEQAKVIKKQGALLKDLNIDAGEAYGEALEKVGGAQFGQVKETLGKFDRLRRATSARAGMAGEKLQAKGAERAAAGQFGGKTLQMMGNFIGKLGPLIGVLGGLAAFIKVLIDADAQAKELNKTLLESGVAGRELYKLGQSAGGAEKAFNSLRSQYTENVLGNLQWMKTAEDQIKLVGELTQAGMGLKNITENQNKSARDLTDQMLTYSTLFGASTSEIAKINADFTMEYLQSQDKVRDGLAGISQAAKTSGMSANRFFASVQSITSQLGLMNFNLGGTAELLNKVTKGSAYGAKVAEKAIGELGKQFEDGSAVNVLGILDDKAGSDQVQRILQRGVELDKIALADAQKRDKENPTEETKKEIAKLTRSVNLGSKAVSGTVVEKINFLESSFSSQFVNTALRTQVALRSVAEAQGKTLDQLKVGDVDNGEMLSLVGKEVAKLAGISIEEADAVVSSLIEGANKDASISELMTKKLDGILAVQAKKSETAKQAAEDLQQAQEISRNTAAVTTAIEIGVTYFLEKIYDVVRRIASYLTDTPEQEALLEMDDHLAELRDTARTRQQELAEAERKYAFEGGSIKDVEKAKAALAEAKENIGAGKKSADALNKALVDLKKMGVKDPSKELINASQELILAGKELPKKQEDIKKEGKAALTERAGAEFKKGLFSKTEDVGKLEAAAEKLRKTIKSKEDSFLPTIGLERDKALLSGIEQRLAELQAKSKPAETAGMTPVPTTGDAFGINKEGFLPFKVSPGDMVVQRDSLVDAMGGPPGAALSAGTTALPSPVSSGTTVTNHININGGDLQRVRAVVMQVLREYEDSQKV